MKIQKKNLGGGGWEGSGWGGRVRVDVIIEFKFLGRFKKKKNLGGVGGPRGSGWGGSGWM